MTALVRFNHWFDDLPEPGRFIVFLGLILVPLQILIVVAPIAAAVATLVLGAMRLWWLCRSRVKRSAAAPTDPLRRTGLGDGGGGDGA